MNLPKLTLVLGGVASGKSAFAETLVMRVPGPWAYVASAEPRDDAMAAKIAVHRARRGEGWKTMETPVEVASALTGVTEGAVLFDCLTMWISNVMEAGQSPEAMFDDLADALTGCPAPVVVVSNEVGLGGIAANTLARRFAAIQGGLNQRLAGQADAVVLVSAGLPIVLKGALP